jgi:ubiquinone/menaquinone biosynthesis C-methylase UbiE
VSKVTSALNAQEHVNAYFQTHASYWNDVYAQSDVSSQVYRERHLTALRWVESLNLAPGSRVLEIGCGAGLFAVDLARRGLRVSAIDSTEAMVAQTRERAAASGLAASISVSIGDTNLLDFEDGTFDLVVALGVLPWVANPRAVVREMARVTRSGGCVLVTVDNRARLHSFFDPWLNPATAWLKRGGKFALARAGLYRPSGHTQGAVLHSRRFTDDALGDAGLAKMRGATVGFGPFTLFRLSVLPRAAALRLHHRLQALADRHVPVLRSAGSHYLALARKGPQGIDRRDVER